MVDSKNRYSQSVGTVAPAISADVETEIRRFLTGSGFSVHFQPVFDLSEWLVGERRVVGLEALARFDLGEGPAFWFGQASLLGLRVDLELAAVSAALAHFDRLPEDGYLTLNISPESVVSPRFVDLLTDEPLERVMIEISESTIADSPHEVHHILSGLRSRGMRVAIDDVGAGLTSLTHLMMYSYDVIKVDLAITRGIDTDSARQAIVKALCALAAATDADVVAEGIEQPEELVALTRLGVPFGQGYWLARPGPLSE